MGLSGLEPPTSRLSGVRSNQLSYRPILVMERVKGIEPSSSAWKAEVLPLNYTRIFKMVEGVGLEPTNPMGADLQSAAFGQLRYPSTMNLKKVARDGIEPPTQGFSVLCSTD